MNLDKHYVFNYLFFLRPPLGDNAARLKGAEAPKLPPPWHWPPWRDAVEAEFKFPAPSGRFPPLFEEGSLNGRCFPTRLDRKWSRWNSSVRGLSGNRVLRTPSRRTRTRRRLRIRFWRSSTTTRRPLRVVSEPIRRFNSSAKNIK